MQQFFVIHITRIFAPHSIDKIAQILSSPVNQANSGATSSIASDIIFPSFRFINRCKVVAEAIIGLLLVFRPKSSIFFLEFFNRKLLFVQTNFSPQSERVKLSHEPIFLSERSFFIMRCVQ